MQKRNKKFNKPKATSNNKWPEKKHYREKQSGKKKDKIKGRI
jgi:hypothetical protein